MKELERLAQTLHLKTKIHKILGHREELEKLLANLQEESPVYNRMVLIHGFDPLEET